RDVLRRCTFQFFLRALHAAVPTAIFERKASLFRRRAENLAPFAIPKYDLVAAGEDLEWLADFPKSVELNRSRLMEVFEVRRVNEVGHRDVIDGEAESFDRICALVGVYG